MTFVTRFFFINEKGCEMVEQNLGKIKLIISQLERQIKRLEHDKKKEELEYLNKMLEEAHKQMKLTLAKANEFTGRINNF